MSSASTMNLTAIAFMREQNDERAIKILCQALQMVHDEFPPTSSDNNENEGDTSNMKQVCDRVGILPCHALPPIQPFDASSAGIPFYNCAFELPPAAASSFGAVATILIFNLGLACHREYIRSGEDDMLRTALSFYSDSISRFDYFQLLERSNGALAVLLAGLYQNASCLHAELYEVEEARSTRFKLTQLLESGQPRDEFSFFRLALGCTMNFDILSAPAA